MLRFETLSLLALKELDENSSIGSFPMLSIINLQYCHSENYFLVFNSHSTKSGYKLL